MNPVERVELLEMRQEWREGYEQIRLDLRAVREDQARGFRDLARREEDTRDRVARMEGGVAMIRWLGPGGVVALVIGILFQAGVLR